MEIKSKTEKTMPSLDELFRELGENTYLHLKTQGYLESLKEERVLIINLIEEIQNGKTVVSENMGESK